MLPLFAALLLSAPDGVRLAQFSCDVTIPLGHRCMGLLPTKSKSIDDPLELHGFVLLSDSPPMVFAALDWCEIRNDSYDAWRDALAKAAGTTRERVLVCSLHQHDAPVVDAGAQDLLDKIGMKGELFDRAFEARCRERASAALRAALPSARPVTHVGTGAATVSQVASNRRVVDTAGRVSFNRGSSSGGARGMAAAPEGLIDPQLRTLSFWNGEEPLLALHAYAVHPMSHYGRGAVSADFVGMARRLRQRDLPRVPQLYASGCSGDVTAGKYNDGAPPQREILARRLHAAMVEAWKTTKREPLTAVGFASIPLELPWRTGARFTRPALEAVLADPKKGEVARIHAAMTLASLKRVEARRPIDLVALRLGSASLVPFPGETFVGHQLAAQAAIQNRFLVPIGYGECWPGYIPTADAFKDDFEDTWLWVGREAPSRLTAAVAKLLKE
ncbi:MAG TPA: hypothetical protein VNC50_15675 [Planctomycetia bacterium]|nr:hypothetical protein [Planctomycetia bacterium]